MRDVASSLVTTLLSSLLSFSSRLCAICNTCVCVPSILTALSVSVVVVVIVIVVRIK